MNQVTEKNTNLKLSNALNNELAVREIKKYYNIDSIFFTNVDIANFYEVDIRTIERVIDNNKNELIHNDLRILKGQELVAFKKEYADFFFSNNDTNHKVVNLTLSTFKTLLNFSMLLKNSKKAALVRSTILDITMNVLQEKTKGNTKYINQRDISYLQNSFIEESERKKFTNALNNFLDMNQYKYAYFTDEVYKLVFKENSKQYKEILNLSKNDKSRDTMYAEILKVIAGFEAGFAYEVEKDFINKGRKLTREEGLEILKNLANHPSHQPHLIDARTKMASRDLEFRDAYHKNLEEYITTLDESDYEKFLGKKSKEIQTQISDHIEVFKRLKDK